MKTPARRRFLQQVGGGMLAAAIGGGLAAELGLATVHGDDAAPRLTFGELEPLASLMQETPADKLLPILVEKLKAGAELQSLVAAGALANVRAFGGRDYIGYHTFMALAPAWGMSRQLEGAQQALPVLKVLHRNSLRIAATGAATEDDLEHASPIALPDDRTASEALRDASRRADLGGADRMFATLAARDAGEAFNHLQYLVEDEVDVHRVALAWRSWETLDLTGAEHAQTLLRQSVRYCADTEGKMKERGRQPSAIRTILPQLLDQYKLVGRKPGDRRADDAWIEATANFIANSEPAAAADAAAAALAEGFSPQDLGEAMSLAANQLLLRDPGRPQQWSSAEKPVGSVHGDSVGVHASDAANAWRNIARVGDARSTPASLIVGAFHTAGQSGRLSRDMIPSPEQLDGLADLRADALAAELDSAIRAKDQVRACALATRCGRLDLPSEPIFKILLGYSVSQEGALHAEKYYRTVVEEFAATRPALRWRHVAGLARVVASEYGHESPGYRLARELMAV